MNYICQPYKELIMNKRVLNYKKKLSDREVQVQIGRSTTTRELTVRTLKYNSEERIEISRICILENNK